MNKIIYMLKQVSHLIRKHKLYFLAPNLRVLVLLAVLVFYIGLPVIISFIYAGV